jgi:hypothetical protein
MGVFSPISNTPTSLKKGDGEFTIAGGVVRDNSEDEVSITPFPYVSYQKKTQEDVTYEFYIFGIKRIDELYRGNRFYFALYESVYAPFYVVGVNLGFLMGYRLDRLDFFLSGKVDGAFATGGLNNIDSAKDMPLGSFTTASGGINFDSKFFIEFSISKFLYDYKEGNHLDEKTFFAFVFLGFLI